MRFFNFIVFIIPVFSLCQCSSLPENNHQLPDGIWRGVIHTQGEELPIQFEIKKDSSGHQAIYLINGDEHLPAGIISMENDSIVFPMHIFDTKIVSSYKNGRLSGFWIKNYLPDYRLPFTAEPGKLNRFSENPGMAARTINGKWDAVFSNQTDTTISVGVFDQSVNHLKATFLLTSGDYRYLDGEVSGDSMFLSTFDGEHAYLFKARIMNDSIISGMYWSGKTWSEPWTARKNENAHLPNTDSLTFLKPGYSKIDFNFPGLDGRPVTPGDPKYKDKILILQILGTWCPNCMDETRFLADWYKKNRDKGVEIIGLSFERKPDFNYASSRVIKMKKTLGADYDFVIAGTSGPGQAEKALPMLRGAIYFPTTIIIDKNGKVVRIHTGFSGPGTGIYYEQFEEEFNAFMSSLLNHPDGR
jgi:thiol-disulfide isomerase/thioredoxin